MIGGLEVVGQSSTASGTPSWSSSSFCAEQVPLLTTPILEQVSADVLMQVHCGVLGSMHSLVGFSWQKPLVGHWASVVQMVSLDRLHEPAASSWACAPAQSPSQASPSLRS